ncbi:MAG: sensor signal transduction histidine kinase [Bryobacterales bacterium]|nr:sensor signal transduction histidine kinase [Bryobacterales bacterium]
MALIVSTVSALGLSDEINRQFDVTWKRSLSIRQLVVSAVKRSQNPKLTPEASVQNNETLTAQIHDIFAEYQALLEIAVCDRNNVILVDTDPDRVGHKAPEMADFGALVNNGSAWEKLQVLLRNQGALTKKYQVADNLVREDKRTGQKLPVLTVHVVIDPALIRTEVMPALAHQTEISIASILGAMGAALLFSTIAFRPLGKLGNMLDMLARGEYELQQVAASKQPADQFGVVASKVNILGEQLRGAQSEISDLKDNFERLLDELEDAVFIFGRDRRLIAAAGAVDKFLARPRAELIGQPLADVFPPGTSLGLLLAQSIQTARPIRNRRVPLNPVNGERSIFIALLSVEFLDASAAGMLIRLRDPEATRQIGRQLQTADRLSAISKLTGGVAHEVKNPLNAILMHVELAKMKLNHGDYDLNPQMEVISSEIMRLDRVVKTFLDFTRPVALNLTDVPLQAFVSDIVELAGPQAEAAGIEVTVEQAAEPVAVTVDTDLLKQALLNIVVNAIEAMPDGGALRIQSTVRGDYGEIRISDTGPGIPPEVREKIYNLYFTTKERGSGIGLAMTFRIVQLHDGTIDFFSEPGKGTTFVVRLPVAVLAV